MLNKVFLIGMVGKEPESKTLANGDACATFSLATSKYYKGKNGEKVTDTTWHNIVAWKAVAGIVSKYVKKGSRLCVEGEIKNRNYEKDGHKVYVSEIVATSIVLLGNKGQENSHEAPGNENESAPDNTTHEAPVDDDSLPF
jgi:single-strand DNA-binding protein